MKIQLTVLACALALGASLQANTSYNYSFTGSSSTGSANAMGNNMTFTVTPVGGTAITVTATAFSTSNTLAIGSGGSTALTAGEVQTYSGAGMGDCNSFEGSGCSSPEHQIDNNGQFDFILLRFSSAVDLTSITLGNFSTGASDMDMTYWTNVSTSLTSVPTGGTTINCGAAGQIACTGGSTITYGATNAGTNGFTGTNVTSLLIGAAYAPGTTGGDYFKIQDLAVTNYVASSTPEPASFVLIGSGLLAGAMFGRRRMKSNS